MNNRLVLRLLMLGGLLSLVLVPAACSSYVSPTVVMVPTPHDIDLGFSNCLVCHTGGQYPIPSDAIHINVGVGMCTLSSCHPVAGAVPIVTKTTTTPPPTGTTTAPPPTTKATAATLSPDAHKMYKDASVCFACHTGLAPVVANPPDHEGYAPTSCLDAGCHVLPQ